MASSVQAEQETGRWGGGGSRRLVFTPRQGVTCRLSSLRTSLIVENRLFNLIIG